MSEQAGIPPTESATAPGRIAIDDQGSDGIIVSLSGRWDVRTVMETESELGRIEPTRDNKGIIDLSQVTLLDTVGAIAILKLQKRLGPDGRIEIAGTRPAHAALLEQVSNVGTDPVAKHVRPTPSDRVAAFGELLVRRLADARRLIAFYGELLVVFFRLAKEPRRFRLTSTISHMQAIGLEAMPIVGMLAFLVGVVLTFISGDQLQRFGAGIFIVNLIGLGVLRELGILITAIIVAGRSGSAFTAEIGTMKINQEVDAMRTIGLDPMEILVVPRTAGLMLILIPLVFFADMVMIGGGALMAKLSLGITFPQFISQFQAAVAIQHLWVGLFKTPFFAFVIAMVGCFHGLEVSGSAESVGRRTTQSVVQSIFLVITLDAIFAVVFWEVGW